jgi:hypothetical protein
MIAGPLAEASGSMGANDTGARGRSRRVVLHFV